MACALIQCQSASPDTQSIVPESIQHNSETNLIDDIEPKTVAGMINAVIEIPSGTVAKWEVDKSNGSLEWEVVNGKNRVVDYLGYPGNYGMIPQTLLPKELGGDGDPLDILVLGPPSERGTTIPCKIIGVLHLQDRGEQDDKLIGVAANSTMFHIDNIEQLDQEYNGISDIIQLWFTNYKGPGKMESSGYGNANVAASILDKAIDAYESMH